MTLIRQIHQIKFNSHKDLLYCSTWISSRLTLSQSPHSSTHHPTSPHKSTYSTWRYTCSIPRTRGSRYEKDPLVLLTLSEDGLPIGWDLACTRRDRDSISAPTVLRSSNECTDASYFCSCLKSFLNLSHALVPAQSKPQLLCQNWNGPFSTCWESTQNNAPPDRV